MASQNESNWLNHWLGERRATEQLIMKDASLIPSLEKVSFGVIPKGDDAHCPKWTGDPSPAHSLGRQTGALTGEAN